jgi:hypothetical protein
MHFTVAIVIKSPYRHCLQLKWYHAVSPPVPACLSPCIIAFSTGWIYMRFDVRDCMNIHHISQKCLVVYVVTEHILLLLVTLKSP